MKAAVDFDVHAQMRDGTLLSANVYRPAGPGPWPTLLTRTPYGKDDNWITYLIDPVRAVRSGFMVVVQDTRGRFASEGEWEPFRHEREDGYDSVEWAAGLTGSNGRVGMLGESYHGNSQWLAAMGQPPSLAAIAPTFTWSNPNDGFLRRGGAVELGLAIPWSLITNVDYLLRLPTTEADKERRVADLIDEVDQLSKRGYWELPAAESPTLARHGLTQVGLLRAADFDEFASWSNVSGHHDRVTVPSLHTGGWYDIFLQGTLDNFAAMAALGRTTQLIVGPWTHGQFADPVGQLVFGLRARRFGVPAHSGRDVFGLQLDWFRRHLAPGATSPDISSPVRIFVMGRNAWRDEKAWPLERAITERYFLHSDGSLGLDGPHLDDAITNFVYDPTNPVPTLGGTTVMSPEFPAGPFDQGAIEARPDVRVFTSEPLNSDLEVTGPVRVVVHAASSAPSTDYVARLCDVHADGRSFNLCDGIVRIRAGAGECARHEIDLWSTSNVFLRGHRLRVQVTSSCFPRWDRNLNTGDQGRTRHAVARQQIFHDARRPSFVELPVIRN
jgi:putative CocE/NonD family hydrolase